jgi:DNA-binding response OmpR family regulator
MERPDLVVLDSALPWAGAGAPAAPERPHVNGLAVIVMGGGGAGADKSRAIRSGADDYVAKPIRPRDLIERIRLLQRRATVTRVLQAGPIEVDLAHGAVSVDGQPVALTVKEFRLLCRLIEARGHVLTRDTLRESVWGHGRAHALDTRTVDVHVGRQRRKLGPAGRYVVTERGLGYRLRR